MITTTLISLLNLLSIALLVLLFLRIHKVLEKNRIEQSQMVLLKSDKKKLEEYSTQLLTKNNWLVTEMHHSVKNNLQILSSLINSQLAFIKSKQGKEAFYQIKNRLYILSLVHQKLFMHASDSRIEMSCCIKEIADYLVDEYDCRNSIKFTLELNTLEVDFTIAIPFALIINELISNTLRFAFPKKGTGEVKIRLQRQSLGNYLLSYSDNGIGLGVDEEFSSGKSLGQTLILGLTRQIKGKLKINRGQGLEIIINFNIGAELQEHFVKS